MRNRTIAALMFVALVAGATVGYIVGSKGTAAIPGTGVHTTCVTSGPTNGMELRVVANNGSWEGVLISGRAVGYCNDQEQSTPLGPSLTNSTGWVSFHEEGLSGVDYLEVVENQYFTLNLSIVTLPLTTTYAILNLSTGNVTTHFCEYDLPFGSPGCPSFPLG